MDLPAVFPISGKRRQNPRHGGAGECPGGMPGRRDSGGRTNGRSGKPFSDGDRDGASGHMVLRLCIPQTAPMSPETPFP